MRYSVRILRRAAREVDEILHFISEVRQAPAGAASWFRAYEKALGRLARSPDAFSLAAEDEYVSEAIRECLFKTRRGKPYRLLFTIVGNEVRVLHVRGPGQDFLTAEELDLPGDPSA